MIVIYFLTPVVASIPPAFGTSVIVTSTLNATSFTMEKIFHAIWWDYSDNKFKKLKNK